MRQRHFPKTDKLCHVLVTGADGFIGSALCPVLEAHGLRVRRAVWKLTASQNAQHDWAATGDIGPDTDWRSMLDGVDVVIHLANRAHIMSETTDNPLGEFRRVNTQGTLKLAEQAQAHSVRRFIFVSSIGVHGETTLSDTVLTENSLARPANDYSQSKWEAELGLQQLADETAWDVVIVRPPLVYGPGVPGNFLRLLHLVARKLPLPLGAVNNRRSFVGLSNLIDFLDVCAVHPAAANQTFLISDNEDVSTPQLIRLLGQHLDISARLFPLPTSLIHWAGRLTGKRRAVNSLIGSLQVDSSKARQMLDWQPVKSMNDQLAQTAAWYKETFL